MLSVATFREKTPSPRNPIQEYSFKSNSRIPQFLRNPVFQNVLRNRSSSPFLDGAKRFYSKNIRTTSTGAPHPLIDRVKVFINENPRALRSIFIFVSGFVIAAIFGSSETVPYTNRSHSVLLSPFFEKLLGESAFRKIKRKYGDKVLPPSHPESVRVLGIAGRMIDVVKSKSRHLEGLEWEIIVVDDPTVNAFCLPGGKIVVFTGLLSHFEEEAEIATIVGHEVGHVVARHAAERVYLLLWLKILQSIFQEYSSKIEVVDTLSRFLLCLPHSRRREMEADYIGLILLASAGYDPRAAPHVYEKLSKVGGSLPLQDYISTHPSGKKRCESLSQPDVMEEAISIYWETTCKH